MASSAPTASACRCPRPCSTAWVTGANSEGRRRIPTFPSHRRLPASLSRSLLQGKGDRFAGRVDHVDCETVEEAGRSTCRPPFGRYGFRFWFFDGVSVAIVTANQFQKRLQTVTESGFHAFSFRWPAHLMNGTWRIVEARIVESEGAVLEIGEKRERSRRGAVPAGRLLRHLRQPVPAPRHHGGAANQHRQPAAAGRRRSGRPRQHHHPELDGARISRRPWKPSPGT